VEISLYSQCSEDFYHRRCIFIKCFYWMNQHNYVVCFQGSVNVTYYFEIFYVKPFF
jgi:hypothetical protein